MGRKRMSTEEFITRAKMAHGDLYNYNNTLFERIDKCVTFLCPKHGEIKQLASNHLMGHGCKKCSVNATRKPQELFLQQAKIVHDNKFDYKKTKYSNSTTKVEIVCKNHGSFFQTPNKHLAGTGCPRCANKFQTTQDFIYKSLCKHGDKYDYSKSVYINDTTKINIICKDHGSFFQLPSNHHSLGQGCPECKLDKIKNNVGVYNEHIFCINPDIKTKPAFFYLIKCYNEEEVFYKVGITTETELKNRFYGIPYNYIIEKSVKVTLFEAFQMEQEFLKQNIKKYKPRKKFNGWTECFII